jgi:hypothetical protein
MVRNHPTLLPCSDLMGAAGPLFAHTTTFIVAAVLSFSSVLAFGQSATVDTKTQPKPPPPARAATILPPPIAR